MFPKPAIEALRGSARPGRGEAPGWGEPRFPHCAVLLLKLTDCGMAFFVICVCLVDVCHTNLMGDTMLSFFLIRFNSVACLCRVLWGFCCGFCVLCVFGCCFCFCWFSFALHVDSSMDYVSIPFSSPFDAHCRHDDVATALIRCLCKMQLAFRLDKRPGKSHMALDGKKNQRGLAEATPRTQNVLAQGQSEAYGDSKLHNTIVEVPARLNSK